MSWSENTHTGPSRVKPSSHLWENGICYFTYPIGKYFRKNVLVRLFLFSLLLLLFSLPALWKRPVAPFRGDGSYIRRAFASRTVGESVVVCVSVPLCALTGPEQVDVDRGEPSDQELLYNRSDNEPEPGTVPVGPTKKKFYPLISRWYLIHLV